MVCSDTDRLPLLLFLETNPNDIERRESVDFLEARSALGGLDILVVKIDFGSSGLLLIM